MLLSAAHFEDDDRAGKDIAGQAQEPASWLA
jgi:hypothetical protein